MYEIRYGDTENHKIVRMNDYERALGFYDRVKRFAEGHGLTWVVALWDGGWLIKSETING